MSCCALACQPYPLVDKPDAYASCIYYLPGSFGLSGIREAVTMILSILETGTCEDPGERVREYRMPVSSDLGIVDYWMQVQSTRFEASRASADYSDIHISTDGLTIVSFNKLARGCGLFPTS